MGLYVVAALLLTFALALLTMAMKHKSLLDPDVERELLERLDKLTPATKARWGRMSVDQMLHHLSGGLQMATGDLAIPARKSPLRLFPIKQSIVFVLPFPKGAPTAPALVARDKFNFDSEREAVSGFLNSFAKREIPSWPDHPAFGPLTRDQWGVMVWKHTDHHLRQFGV